MKLKKWLTVSVFFMVICLCFVFTGCGSKQSDRTPSSYKIAGNEDTVYYVGDEFDADGYKIQIFDENQKMINEIDVNDSFLKESPAMAEAGKKKVIFTYQGKEYSFEIEVKEKENEKSSIKSFKESLAKILGSRLINGSNDDVSVDVNIDLSSKIGNTESDFEKQKTIFDSEMFDILEGTDLVNKLQSCLIDAIVEKTVEQAAKGENGEFDANSFGVDYDALLVELVAKFSAYQFNMEDLAIIANNVAKKVGCDDEVASLIKDVVLDLVNNEGIDYEYLAESVLKIYGCDKNGLVYTLVMQCLSQSFDLELVAEKILDYYGFDDDSLVYTLVMQCVSQNFNLELVAEKILSYYGFNDNSLVYAFVMQCIDSVEKGEVDDLASYVQLLYGFVDILLKAKNIELPEIVDDSIELAKAYIETQFGDSSFITETKLKAYRQKVKKDVNSIVSNLLGTEIEVPDKFYEVVYNLARGKYNLELTGQSYSSVNLKEGEWLVLKTVDAISDIEVGSIVTVKEYYWDNLYSCETFGKVTEIDYDGIKVECSSGTSTYDLDDIVGVVVLNLSRIDVSEIFENIDFVSVPDYVVHVVELFQKFENCQNIVGEDEKVLTEFVGALKTVLTDVKEYVVSVDCDNESSLYKIIVAGLELATSDDISKAFEDAMETVAECYGEEISTIIENIGKDLMGSEDLSIISEFLFCDYFEVANATIDEELTQGELLLLSRVDESNVEDIKVGDIVRFQDYVKYYYNSNSYYKSFWEYSNKVGKVIAIDSENSTFEIKSDGIYTAEFCEVDGILISNWSRIDISSAIDSLGLVYGFEAPDYAIDVIELIQSVYNFVSIDDEDETMVDLINTAQQVLNDLKGLIANMDCDKESQLYQFVTGALEIVTDENLEIDELYEQFIDLVCQIYGNEVADFVVDVYNCVELVFFVPCFRANSAEIIVEYDEGLGEYVHNIISRSSSECDLGEYFDSIEGIISTIVKILPESVSSKINIPSEVYDLAEEFFENLFEENEIDYTEYIEDLYEIYDVTEDDLIYKVVNLCFDILLNNGETIDSVSLLDTEFQVGEYVLDLFGYEMPQIIEDCYKFEKAALKLSNIENPSEEDTEGYLECLRAIKNDIDDLLTQLVGFEVVVPDYVYIVASDVISGDYQSLNDMLSSFVKNEEIKSYIISYVTDYISENISDEDLTTYKACLAISSLLVAKYFDVDLIVLADEYGIELPDFIKNTELDELLYQLGDDLKIEKIINVGDVSTTFVFDDNDAIVGEKISVSLDVNFDITLIKLVGTVTFDVSINY